MSNVINNIIEMRERYDKKDTYNSESLTRLKFICCNYQLHNF